MRILLFVFATLSSTAQAVPMTVAGTVDFGGNTCVDGQTGTVPYTLTFEYDPSLPYSLEDGGITRLFEASGKATLGGRTYVCSLDHNSSVFVSREAGYGNTLGASCVTEDQQFSLAMYFLDDTRTLLANGALPQAPVGPFTHYVLSVRTPVSSPTCLASDTSVIPMTVEPALAQRVTSMVAVSDADYTAAFGGPSVFDEGSSAARRRPSVVQAELQEAVDLLHGSGCLAYAQPDGHASGVYSSTLWTATDEHGEASAATHGGGSAGFVTSRGLPVGNEGIGLRSALRGTRLVAERDDGGVQVGRWVRVAGSRGAWFSVSATCDDPRVDVFSVLDGWIGGGLL